MIWVRRALIAAGIAVLLYVARMLPVFVLRPDAADWWFRRVIGDPSGGMGFAHVAAWMFVEVPILFPLGIVLIALGAAEKRP